jgi:hypothetical protein
MMMFSVFICNNYYYNGNGDDDDDDDDDDDNYEVVWLNSDSRTSVV